MFAEGGWAQCDVIAGRAEEQGAEMQYVRLRTLHADTVSTVQDVHGPQNTIVTTGGSVECKLTNQAWKALE